MNNILTPQIAQDLANRLREGKAASLLDGIKRKKELSWRIWKPGTVMEKFENYVTLLESGAGDGNRTRI